MKIIIAELNRRNSYEDFYTGNHEYYTGWYKELIKDIKERLKNPDIDIYVVFTFDELKQKLDDNKFERCIVFSNFPGDNTYKRYKLETGRDGNQWHYSGGYDRTFYNYRKLLDDHFNLDLHIVTGAPKSMLFDSEVRLLSKYHKITIMHYSDLEASPYMDYVDFLVKTVEQTIEE